MSSQANIDTLKNLLPELNLGISEKRRIDNLIVMTQKSDRVCDNTRIMLDFMKRNEGKDYLNTSEWNKIIQDYSNAMDDFLALH